MYNSRFFYISIGPSKYFQKLESDTFCTLCSDEFPFCDICDKTACFACVAGKFLDTVSNTCFDGCPD